MSIKPVSVKEQVKEKLEIRLLKAQEKRSLLTKQVKEKSELGLGADSSGTYPLEIALVNKDRIAVKIDELHKALHRLEKGTYNRCEACRQKINPARLEILPTTTLCIQCA